MDIRKAAAQYIRKGYQVPIPLPAGEKQPPARGLSGNIPYVHGEQLAEAWKGVTEGNLALTWIHRCSSGSGGMGIKEMPF